MKRALKPIYILLSFWFCAAKCPLTEVSLNEAVDEFELPELYDLDLTNSPKRSVKQLKEWTFITYMAADNDLAPFARKNLAQQVAVGSNDRVNVLVHLDTKIPGNKKITKRYLVKKDKLLITNPELTTYMDSGNPNTLIDCCKWAIENFPARNYALILWNHGTGIIDIERPRTINPSDLFTFNPANNLIELDRSIPFLQFIELEKEDQKGICFDDSTGHYLTNQGLEHALKTITHELLGGKKIAIIGFDACLMSMLEIANIVKDYCQIAVGSQEVELGTGWEYDLVLAPLMNQSMTPKVFAQHIVSAYEAKYAKITNDYTQSAINLEALPAIEAHVDQIGELLIECIKHQINNSVKDAIRTSRHKLLCTHFDEPSYVDLHHLLSNLHSNLTRFKVDSVHLLPKLKKELEEGMHLITQVVFANTVGKNLNRARGLSIYFPDRKIHSSYRKTKFAGTNKWAAFINFYLS